MLQELDPTQPPVHTANLRLAYMFSFTERAQVHTSSESDVFLFIIILHMFYTNSVNIYINYYKYSLL